MTQETQNKIIEMYSKRRSISQIERETGVKQARIVSFLKEKQIWNGHKYMLHYFNEFYFDKIDTPEKAYWLGFLFADGYLTPSSHTIGLELESKEIEHLEKFKKALSAEQNIHIYHKNSTFGPQVNCRFIVSSAHMVDILAKYFGSYKKTLDGILPTVAKELQPHLLRGYFDGDGSLSWTHKPDGHIISPRVSFTGTKESLEKIEEITGFKWNWSARHPDRPINNYSTACGKIQNVMSFLDFIYKDAPVYLDRQYQKYLEVKQNREQFSAKARA